MRAPSPSEHPDGENERLPAPQPASPAAGGEALVEHLAARLARAEQALRVARERADSAERDRGLLASLARHLSQHPGSSLEDAARLVLSAFGHWCLVDEQQGERLDRRLVALDAAVEREAGALLETGAPDPLIGLPRAVRGGRIERLAALPRDEDKGDAGGDAPTPVERLAGSGPLLLVPVFSAGRAVAALTFGRYSHEPEYDEHDERLAAELAVLLAIATEQRSAMAVADAALRAKAEFLSVMSHELRTPLNAIAGYAQLLEMGFRGELNEGQRDAVGRILSGQEHLLELVDAVLTFSRLTSGGVALDVENVPAGELMDRACEPLVADFAGRRIDFRVASCSADVVVRADRDRATQVLRHMLDNALKFTPAGGRVTLECEEGPGLVHMIVTDDGPGIPEAKRESIFRPFVQAERGPARSAEGTGLGLSIGRELAERMGGSLTVTGNPGAGSRFVLCLARSQVD